MSGHSKWSTIKRKKALIDAKRSKVWTKIIREISIAVKEGGADESGNPRLSLAIDNAKSANMPKDTMERAIAKASGDSGSDSFVEINYEGYGPGGIAYFIETTTDNVNRTVAEIRNCFSKLGGNLGLSGSVAYLFSQKGIITVPTTGVDEDELMMIALETNAEDIKNDGEYFEITTAREDLFKVRQVLEDASYAIENAELQRIPSTFTKVDQEHALANFKLIEKLDELEDVGNVFTNMEMDEETLEVAETM